MANSGAPSIHILIFGGFLASSAAPVLIAVADCETFDLLVTSDVFDSNVDGKNVSPCLAWESPNAPSATDSDTFIIEYGLLGSSQLKVTGKEEL